MCDSRKMDPLWRKKKRGGGRRVSPAERSLAFKTSHLQEMGLTLPVAVERGGGPHWQGWWVREIFLLSLNGKGKNPRAKMVRVANGTGLPVYRDHYEERARKKIPSGLDALPIETEP